VSTPPGAHRTLGLGAGWRPQLALAIERHSDLGFVEITAENFSDPAGLPEALLQLCERGTQVVVHGIGLSLGGGEPIDRRRVQHLQALATRVKAPLVSEHIAFVRAGGKEAGHLLPIPRTRSALAILIDNIKAAQDCLQVPLALENISAFFEWPGREIGEAEFISEALEKTGALLLLDIANIHANCVNLGGDALEFLDHLPLERLAYVHIAGGCERDGAYHDTHAHEVSDATLELLSELAARAEISGVMLERDDDFPKEPQFHDELAKISSAWQAGKVKRGAHAGI